MARASSDQLDGLHAEVAAALTSMVKGDGVDNKILAVAIKFLKDNGIDAPASSPRMSNLVDQLRSLDVEEASALPN